MDTTYCHKTTSAHIPVVNRHSIKRSLGDLAILVFNKLHVKPKYTSDKIFVAAMPTIANATYSAPGMRFASNPSSNSGAIENNIEI